MQSSGPILLLLLAIAVSSSPTLNTLVSESSARIVNGYAVDITKIPYQAALRRRASTGWAHMCGAVVINIRVLLTAAHCISSYESQPSLLRVVVGTSYRLSGGKTYELSQVIVHESYSSVTLQNDIGMVVTSKKMKLSQSVHPVAYATDDHYLTEGTEAVVSGYGTTEYEGTSSSVLLAARVKIVAQVTCARAYLRIATVTSDMVCASGVEPPRDACQGDSGGPLVSNGVLIGIVSWGEGCADMSYPGVYTRVSQYNEWINKKLAQIY